LAVQSELIRRELLADPERPNKVIAELAGVSATTVSRTRHQLAEAGLISGRGGRTPIPAIPVLPLRPALDGALCAQPGADPGLWTSPRPADRQAAIATCWRCPALDACRSWALSLPTTDTAIWGAMTSSERVAARRELASAS
jgi:Transcription factor WhiB